MQLTSSAPAAPSQLARTCPPRGAGPDRLRPLQGYKTLRLKNRSVRVRSQEIARRTHASHSIIRRPALLMKQGSAAGVRDPATIEQRGFCFDRQVERRMRISTTEVFEARPAIPLYTERRARCAEALRSAAFHKTRGRAGVRCACGLRGTSSEPLGEIRRGHDRVFLGGTSADP